MSQEQVIAVRTSEAMALFQAGQSGRTAMLTGLGLFFSIATVTASAAIAIGSVDPVLPLPAFGLLIGAYVLQQYVNVTVLGSARRRLEELVNTALPEAGLISGSVVAGTGLAAIPAVTSYDDMIDSEHVAHEEVAK